jgi:GT2 family glycosyltransferase
MDGRLSMAPAEQVTVVLLNWRRIGDTINCLDSIARLSGYKPSVIVCDNNSGDGSETRLRQYSHESELDVEVLQTGANLGFAGGVNVGLRAALANPSMAYVWILNNDTQVDPAALKALLDTMLADPKIGICGSTLLYLDEPTKIQAVGGTYNPWLGTTRHSLGHDTYSPDRIRAFDDSTLDYVVGASMFVRREVLETVGLMDEQYFLYYEEIDWAYQLRNYRPDLRLGYAPESIVYHAEGASTGRNDREGKGYSYTSDFYMLTSRLKCTRKNCPDKVWSVRLSMLLVAINRWRRHQPRSARLALCLALGLPTRNLNPVQAI